MASNSSDEKFSPGSKIVYKLVLTGGPCGGKTTAQASLSMFFENLGWKVYRSPEAATVLIGGGVKFPELAEEQANKFQENLIDTMLQIEQTYFDLAEGESRNCLVICDRGVMDATAYMTEQGWSEMKERRGWTSVEMRDSRYSQVIRMVTAAEGAEDFYTVEHDEYNKIRYESVEHARGLDNLVAKAWVGHPYYDVIDNSTDFKTKMTRTISAVCDRLGIEVADRLAADAVKRKYLITDLPDLSAFPDHQEFDVVHDYLVCVSPSNTQARVRRRGQQGVWTYVHTVRKPKVKGQRVELRRQINSRDYLMLLSQKDVQRLSVFKKRLCFLWEHHYFQLDIYQSPCHKRCDGLIILETYTTTQRGPIALPPFLTIEREITGEPAYSMHHLSLAIDQPVNGSTAVPESP